MLARSTSCFRTDDTASTGYPFSVSLFKQYELSTLQESGTVLGT